MSKLISIIITIFVGLLVGFLLSFAVESVFFQLFAFKLVTLESIFTQTWYKALIGVLNPLLMLALGAFVALKSRKKKGDLYRVFKPTPINLLVNLGLTVLYLIIAYPLIKSNQGIVLSPQTYQTINPVDIRTLPFSVFSYFLTLYPVTAILLSFFRDKKLAISSKTLLVVMLIFMNPLVLGWGQNFRVKYTYYLDSKNGVLENCGARIISLNKTGPAEKAGLKPYEVIHKVDGLDISTTNDLLGFLNELKTPRTLKIQTDLNTYNVEPTKDARNGNFRLGITMDQNMCRQDP